jgi:hypothetical protein
VNYGIEPLHLRQSPPTKPNASCNVWYNVMVAEISVWGAGFESSDFGDRLREGLEGCFGLTLSGWWFTYRPLGKTQSDGIEWNAGGAYPIGPGGWTCVANAVAKADGGPVTCGER